MSDIFEEYARIALEQGLLSEAAEEGTPQVRDLPAAELFYGIKPNGDEKSIVEQAHPESVVVSPAYDRVNGLVENIQERQNIIHKIVTKPTHGKLTNERYVKAKAELFHKLITNAVALDRDNQSDLMTLADSCAEKLTKTALLPAALLGIPMIYWKLGALSLASMGLLNHFGGKISGGLGKDIDRVIEELQDLTTKMPGQSDKLSSLMSHLQEVKSLYEELKMFNVTAHDEKLAKSQIDNGTGLLIKYIKAVKILTKEISDFEKLLQAAKTDSDWMPSWMGDAGVLLQKGIDLVWSDDYSDVLTLLPTLKESLIDSISQMRELYTAVRNAAENNDTKSLEKLLSPSQPKEQEAPEEKEPKKDRTKSPYLPFQV